MAMGQARFGFRLTQMELHLPCTHLVTGTGRVRIANKSFLFIDEHTKLMYGKGSNSLKNSIRHQLPLVIVYIV